MKRRAMRLFAFLLSLFAVLTVTSIPVFASDVNIPFDSYTYWDNISGDERKAVYNRQMFDVMTMIGASDLGVESFTELVDVCVNKNGYVYVLDSDSRIIVLDSNYKFIKEITEVVGKNNYTFKKASSLYVHSDNTIFISDTENKRVIHCTDNGEYIDEFVLPDSPLIPENFDFKPIKVVADSKGYVYILSRGSYYGALLYAPDKSFIGFYGANTVTNGILGSIQSLLNQMFPNANKKGNSQRVLPYAFSDIVIDDDNFIYTATDSAEEAQIKKLNPGEGNNILNSDDVNFADDEKPTAESKTEINLKQKITGVAVDKDGFIYCLDSTYGRIYLYDSECRMITAFGGGDGNGTQKGSFINAVDIEVKDDEVLVCDKSSNTVTVFKKNDYGNKVTALTKMTIVGDYSESKKGWEECLKLDRNLQIAYTGIARSYIASGDYKSAMDMALEGYDRETYTMAFEYYRTQWLSKNFYWFFSLIILVIVLIIVSCVIINKKKIVLFKNQEVKLMFETLFHPSYAFEKIKDKNQGSVLLACIILALFYVTAVLKTLLGGFLFTEYDPGTFNPFWVFVQTVGLVVLWVVSNWLVCTLAQGIGKIREIFITTCYSLMPLIFARIIWILLSRVLLQTEGVVLTIISTVFVLYAAVIFIIGMMRMHDYTMPKFLGTTVLSLLGICAIVFLIVLVVILVQQTYGFATTVLMELFM